jgi:hypothetical protein
MLRRLMKTNRRKSGGDSVGARELKYLNIFVFIWILLVAQKGFAKLQADINKDGVVNFADFAVLANEWLSDSNEGFISPKYEVTFPSLGLIRDSPAYDTNFRKLPENVARYESICIASRPTVWVNREIDKLVQTIDGDLIICSDGEYGVLLYTTTDGVNFTKLADISKDQDFVGYYEPNDTTRLVKVMPDGSWLLSFGQMDLGGPGKRGHLFRSVDKGLTWTHVLEYERGYTPWFGWYAISDNEVAVGEYGLRNQNDTPRRVYYSDDYGVSWSKIWEPNPRWGEHCHLVAFGAGNTDVLYVSYGDAECKKVIKLVYTPGEGGKRNINNWSEAANSPILAREDAPTCAFSDGRYLYLGHDGVGITPILWRLDPTDDSLVSVLDWPAYFNDLNHPYKMYEPMGYVFGMVIHDGVYYTAVRGVIDHKDGGIYVSTDGEHWVCAYRVEGYDGFFNIVGYASSYLWGTYYDNRVRLFKMSPLRAKLITAMQVERGVTNQFNTPHSSSFEDGVGGWGLRSTSEDIDEELTGLSTETALDGASSYKIVCKNKGRGEGNICSGYCPVNPALGDYICASFWVKGAATWPDEYSCIARIESDTYSEQIDTTAGWFDVRDTWQKVTVWGRCINDNFAKGVRLWLTFRSYDYVGNFSNATCYVDCAQVSYFSDLHYSGPWQIGGTPRADEVATGSLVGLDAEFTTTFEWRPDCSSREWHGNIYIASWTDGDENIDFYYDNATSKFVATDGTNTAVTTQTFSWEHFDSIKLALTNMGGDFRLSVQTPLNGVEHVLTNNGDTKLGPPVAVTFDTYSRRTSYGCGLIANVKHFDLPLTISEIQKLFDLVETSGR